MRHSLPLLLILIAGGCRTAAPPAQILRPFLETAAVTDDADDPAIWLHPTDPTRNLILGTNKAPAPSGALVVFSLDGRIRQTITGLDRPNNVDVQDNLAVVAERYKNQLRIFRIDPATGTLTDVTAPGGTLVKEAPMGVGLYKRPSDGTLFAIVAPKTGPADGYLGQYRLDASPDGTVRATLVRSFGRFSGTGEIEAVAVDDALGFVYYADELSGIRKYHADPGHPDAARELAHFATAGFQGDREGIAIIANPDGTGIIVCSDQIPNATRLHLFSRQDPTRSLGVFTTSADSTDGLEAAPDFLILMNSKGKNFHLYRMPK